MDTVGAGAAAIFFIALFAVAIAGFVFWIYALVDAIRWPDHVYKAAGSDKVIWIVVVAVVGWIGGLIYWFVIRNKLVAIESSGQGNAYLAAEAARYRLPGPVDAGGPPAGWYADPEAPGHQRYWDGVRWTEHRQ
jgi:hypothetical protein